MEARTGIGRWIQGFEGIAEIAAQETPLHSFSEILDWLEDRKKSQHIQINQIPLEACQPWYYDHSEGVIRNPEGSFFRIGGMVSRDLEGDEQSQPIILQPEIGYLGIVCRRFGGVWHFLMQAKIEPGNINYVQISPTLQATKSNFTRRHGGKEPPYLSLFQHMRREDILVDQIQSELSSRFWGKRNRNVIIKTEEEVPELPSHRWMTLDQIRACMRRDNLVNMDTRTVLSCLPYVFMMDSVGGYASPFANSMRAIRHEDMTEIYLRMNNYKMFHAPARHLVPLLSLPDWSFAEGAFRHRQGYPFQLIFCQLNIEGREVTRWNQPLFAALGQATFGLICRVREGRYEALVRVKPEMGCFDGAELGPSVQEEPGQAHHRDSVAQYFFNQLAKKDGVLTDVALSEEGGRFYHEQNRNVILLSRAEIGFDPDQYVWVTLGTLNAMTQINNCLNIQLRNLLMLLAMRSMTREERKTDDTDQ